MLILKGLEGNIIPSQIAALQDYASLLEPKRVGTPPLAGLEEFLKTKKAAAGLPHFKQGFLRK